MPDLEAAIPCLEHGKYGHHSYDEYDFPGWHTDGTPKCPGGRRVRLVEVQPDNLMTRFPSDYEWALLDRWLESLIDTDRDYEARLVMVIVKQFRDAAVPGPTYRMENLDSDEQTQVLREEPS